jgi:hypothetical protein
MRGKVRERKERRMRRPFLLLSVEALTIRIIIHHYKEITII